MLEFKKFGTKYGQIVLLSQEYLFTLSLSQCIILSPAEMGPHVYANSNEIMSRLKAFIVLWHCNMS